MVDAVELDQTLLDLKTPASPMWASCPGFPAWLAWRYMIIALLVGMVWVHKVGHDHLVYGLDLFVLPGVKGFIGI